MIPAISDAAYRERMLQQAKDRRVREATARLREGVENLVNDSEERYWAKNVERQLGLEQETDFWHTFMMGKD